MKKLLIILSGMVVLAVGIFLFISEKGLAKRCTTEAVGTVVDIKVEENLEEDDGITRTTYTYFPIIEYNAGDKAVSKQSTTGSSGSPSYNVNDKIDILYNPNNVEEFIIKGDTTSNILSIVFIAVGVIIVFIGIVKRI